jgi:hypothetical protein
MLRSLKATLGYHLAATDGEVGRVQDYLFDEESWLVHYVVIGLQRKKVLLIPWALGRPDWNSKSLAANLTRDEIHKSPSADRDIPISQQRQLGLKRPGSHLRSMRELVGYNVYASDSELGSIEDFICDDRLWSVHHVIVSLSGAPARMIALAPESIRSISWYGKAAWVNLTRDEVEKNPASSLQLQ